VKPIPQITVPRGFHTTSARFGWALCLFLTSFYTVGGAIDDAGWRRAIILVLGVPPSVALLVALIRAGNVSLRFGDSGVSYTGWFRTLDLSLESVTVIGWIVIPGFQGQPTSYQFMFKVAGHLLEADVGDLEWADGAVRVKGVPERSKPTAEIAASVNPTNKAPPPMKILAGLKL